MFKSKGNRGKKSSISLQSGLKKPVNLTSAIILLSTVILVGSALGIGSAIQSWFDDLTSNGDSVVDLNAGDEPDSVATSSDADGGIEATITCTRTDIGEYCDIIPYKTSHLEKMTFLKLPNKPNGDAAREFRAMDFFNYIWCVSIYDNGSGYRKSCGSGQPTTNKSANSQPKGTSPAPATQGSVTPQLIVACNAVDDLEAWARSQPSYDPFDTGVQVSQLAQLFESAGRTSTSEMLYAQAQLYMGYGGMGAMTGLPAKVRARECQFPR